MTRCYTREFSIGDMELFGAEIPENGADAERLPVPGVRARAAILRHDNGAYGFKVWFQGAIRPHWQMHVFETANDAMTFLDPHRERVWEDPAGLDPRVVRVSRGFVPGSVEGRMLETLAGGALKN